jgi:YD repeat-containing protein
VIGGRKIARSLIEYGSYEAYGREQFLLGEPFDFPVSIEFSYNVPNCNDTSAWPPGFKQGKIYTSQYDQNGVKTIYVYMPIRDTSNYKDLFYRNTSAPACNEHGEYADSQDECRKNNTCWEIYTFLAPRISQYPISNSCPEYYTSYSNGYCHSDLTGEIKVVEEGESEEDKGKPPECVGNPCNPATGNKYESATDFSGGGLSFIRSYNSLEDQDVGLGVGWTGNRLKRLEISSATELLIRHADGKGEPFTKAGGTWSGDPDSDRLLSETASGYTVTLKDGSTEQYDTSGKLIAEADRNGQATTYTYDSAGKLATITGPYGHTLQLVYNANGHLVSLTDPNGELIEYTYDGQNNLASVSYPDGGLRLYHYENTDFPNHLTGITDENGDRYATFAYDAEGRAVFTGHAQTTNTGPQEGFTLEYQDGGGE